MRRVLSTLVIATVLAVAMNVVAHRVEPRASAAQGDGKDVVLALGDRVRVDGEPIGCQVARQGGSTYLDCRRGGSLAGTYGTLLGARDAMIVRFTSTDTAKVVFTAKHRGRARRCH
jgi:hypothetical protein